MVFKNLAHHVADQIEIAADEFCPKSLKRKLMKLSLLKVIFTFDETVL